MEYWEFLLQQEGSRSWQPLKSKTLCVVPGRYRIVAHSSRTNAEVEVCVTHTTTEEVPPKRRSQKRSRRTNPDGLMVVIPFTYLKPGIWELRCCSDIMSDFLGKSWQNIIKLQVLAPSQATNPTTPEISPSSELIQEATAVAEPAVSVPNGINASEPAVSVPNGINAPEPAVSVPNGINAPEPALNVSNGINTSEPAVSVPNGINASEPAVNVPNASEPLPVTLVEVETLIPVNLDELEVETSIDRNSASPSNPILEQSLQMLEQILQQVLDPVLEEFEEPSESPSEPEAEELVAPQTSIWQGIALNLETDAYTTKRGEELTISGCVALDDKQELPHFQGSLRYQLRDPQSSQLLLDIQHPVATQTLPISFSHNLEIPPCNTRLILGKITLYDDSAIALTSQPFTVTADLDSLLESIIPGTKVMPVAKMLVLANRFESLEDQEALSQLPAELLEPVVIDLIDTSLPQKPLAPAAQKFMPPQIYKPEVMAKGSKPLQLPNFPKLSVNTDTEKPTEEVKSEATQEDTTKAVDSLVEAKPVLDSQELTPEVANLESVSQEEASSSDQELSVLLVSLDDRPADAGEVMQEAATITPVSEVEEKADLELSEFWDTPVETPQTEVAPAETLVDEPVALDNAFQALKSQDRFWLRLNSLATDAELSQWLQSDQTPRLGLGDDGTQASERLTEFEEVQSENDGLITDFDASIWDNSEARDQSVTELGEQGEADLGLPPQLPEVGIGDRDWTIEEIVVDDDDDQQVFIAEPPITKPLPVRQEIKPTAEVIAASKAPVMKPSPVNFETPLPAPKVLIPKDELAVGEPVIVRVKLPPHNARLCVKLWVQDRQSRALLDGPRWLVDLLPDGSGQLEAMTQVVVPFGFDEIRFEAIAVDLDSQRESHKVTVDCAVMPPDLPNFSLDDFA